MSEVRTAVPPDPTAALRAALDAANRRVADTQAQNTDLQTRLRSETSNRFVAQEAAVDNAIAQAEAEAGTYQRQWSALQAEAKFDEAGDALRKMTEATARAQQARAQKDWLAGQRQNAQAQPAQQTDPLAGYAPHARDWISRNQRFLTDETFKNKVLEKHFEAIGSGKPEGSQAYYDLIERAVYPERYTDDQATPQPQSSAHANTQASDGLASQEQSGEGATADSPLSDTGEDVQVSIEPSAADRHTLRAAVNPVTIPANEMRIDLNADGTPITEIKQEPQTRAVGKGGPGISSVAAPPSRNINMGLQRTTGGRPQVLDSAEMDTALRLAEQLQPDLLERPNAEIEVAKWYALLNSSPSAQRKLKKWYGGTA
jgi:hypothetical protein